MISLVERKLFIHLSSIIFNLKVYRKPHILSYLSENCIENRK